MVQYPSLSKEFFFDSLSARAKVGIQQAILKYGVSLSGVEADDVRIVRLGAGLVDDFIISVDGAAALIVGGDERIFLVEFFEDALVVVGSRIPY